MNCNSFKNLSSIINYQVKVIICKEYLGKPLHLHKLQTMEETRVSNNFLILSPSTRCTQLHVFVNAFKWQIFSDSVKRLKSKITVIAVPCFFGKFKGCTLFEDFSPISTFIGIISDIAYVNERWKDNLRSRKKEKFEKQISHFTLTKLYKLMK